MSRIERAWAWARTKLQLGKEERTRLVLKTPFCVIAPLYFFIGTRTFQRLFSTSVALKLLHARVTFKLVFPLYRSYVYSSRLHLGHSGSFLCASISKESGSSNCCLPRACLSHSTSNLMQRKLVPLILTLCSVTTWCPVLSNFFLYIAFGKLHTFLQFSSYFVFWSGTSG